MVTIVPNPPIFYIDHPLQINCSFQLSTPFTVIWRRDDQVIPDVTTEQLIVDRVPQSWDGSCVSCEVDGDGVTGFASVNISVVCK